MQDYRLHSGKLAGLWLFVCLFSFGAAYPGYSQLTKAVSELGAFGAPHALLWNLLGFGLTGLLILLFGTGLQRLLTRQGVKSTGGWAVIALGLFFAATAVPADFERRLESPWTQAHALFVLLGPVAFLWGAIVWPGALASLGVSRGSRLVCIAAGWLMLPAFASNAFLTQAPGLGQRLGFLAMFAWCYALSSAVCGVRAGVVVES